MEYDLEEILALVKKKMREQGAFDREAYRYYVEETISYFIEKGKLSEEDNEELIKDQLMEMYEVVKDRVADED